jgi:chloramphenicol-sensitive protein RarD
MSPTALALLAYAWWGFVPVYWKLLHAVPAEELILYRVLLSCLFLAPIVWWRKQSGDLWQFAKSARISLGLFVSSLLIGFNWYLYVWAVNHDHVVDASLGYFLNPLVNVAFGTIFLQERMRRAQWGACFVAALGAGLLVWYTGKLPWIALLLAISFAFYGLLRKQLRVSTFPGTLWETLLLAIPSLIALLFLLKGGQSQALQGSTSMLLLLSLAGFITTVPLLAFAEAAKQLPLSVMGFFQFLSPSIQFILGVFVYNEPFSPTQWLAFACIWLGLGIFLLDSWRHSKK